MEDGLVYYNAAYALHISLPQQTAEKPVPIVIILPGGAYYKLSTKYEGSEVAQWFNQQGIAAAVLHYRMPNHHSEWPQQDIDRAIDEIRSHASTLGIDVHRIGLMGFSAGGHAAAIALTRNLPLAFAVLFYPVISMDRTITHLETHNWLLNDQATPQDEQAHSAHLLVHSNMPPTLMIACEDDDLVPMVNSQLYFEALQQAGVPAQLYVLPQGGHGWGFSPTTPSPQKVYAWLTQFLHNQGIK